MRAIAVALLLVVLTQSAYSQEKKDKRPKLFNGGLIKRIEELQEKIKKDREEKRKEREKAEAEKKKAKADQKRGEKDAAKRIVASPASSSSRRNSNPFDKAAEAPTNTLAPQIEPGLQSNPSKVQLGLVAKPGGIGANGLVVAKVEKSSPAAKAGLKEKDKITSVGGSPIKREDDLKLILDAFEPGDRTEIEFVRSGKKQKTLIEFPGQNPAPSIALNSPVNNGSELLPLPTQDREKPIRTNQSPLASNSKPPILPLINEQNKDDFRAGIGVTAIAVDPELFARQKLSVRQGAYLDEITKGSAAEKAGLKVGDVVIAVDGRKVDSAISMAELIQMYKPGDKALVLYYQGNRLKRTEIKMDAIPVSQLAYPPSNFAQNDPFGRAIEKQTPKRNSVLGDLGNEFPRLKNVEKMIERFSTNPKAESEARGSSVQYNRTPREAELENEVKSLREQLSGQDRQIKTLTEKLNLIEKLLKGNQK